MAVLAVTNKLRWLAYVAGAAFVTVANTNVSIAANRSRQEYLVIDNHPTGGPGATNLSAIVPGPSQPGAIIEPPTAAFPYWHVGGVLFGQPDPELTDPSAVGGHGIAIPLPLGSTEAGTVPLAIVPITSPLSPEPAAATGVFGSSAQSPVILSIDVTQLDAHQSKEAKSMTELRDAIHDQDVIHAAKDLPKLIPPATQP